MCYSNVSFHLYNRIFVTLKVLPTIAWSFYYLLFYAYWKTNRHFVVNDYILSIHQWDTVQEIISEDYYIFETGNEQLQY